MAFIKFVPITFLLSICTSIASSAVPTPTFSSLIGVESPIAIVANATLLNGTFSDELPPDPYYLRPYPMSSLVAIEFSKYTPGIPPLYALQCISIAQRDTAFKTFQLQSSKSIYTPLSYRFRTVTLTVTSSGNSVKWAYWGLILSAMPELFAEYEYVGFDFVILVSNRAVGLGSLSWSHD